MCMIVLPLGVVKHVKRQELWYCIWIMELTGRHE